jgi:hypothetical protein
MNATATATTRFEVGKSYSCRSLCDYNCVFSFDVVSRTEGTVTLRYGGEVTRRKIRVRNGVESCSPFGSYSMSPTLNAN